MQEKIKALKNELISREKAFPSFFLKQGSFSVYYCKELDYFIKKSYELLLFDFFEEYLPSDLPFCVLASGAYSDNKLCFKQALGLIFVYKDIKAYHLKPMIKAFIGLLNDLGLIIEYQIIELTGLSNKIKNENKFLSIRYLCGSKNLFKSFNKNLNELLKEQRKSIARELFAYFEQRDFSFITQESNIKKDFGGLDDYANLHSLLTLFKDSPKSYALHFISEKELSLLRLAMDYVLSMQSAMNLHNGKDIDKLNLNELDELALIMQKKDKKNYEAKEALLQKLLSSLQCVGVYAKILASCVAYKQGFANFNKEINFHTLSEFLTLWLKDDTNFKDDALTLLRLKELKISKKDLENTNALFKQILVKKHSFSPLKMLHLSGILAQIVKPLSAIRFMLNDESAYAADEHALLLLQEFEAKSEEFEIIKSLDKEELAAVKLSIILSGVRDENEVSLANIYRFCSVKFDIKNEALGLKIFKYFHILKEIIQKEDIYNETIIFTLVTKLEDEKTLRLLYILTLLDANLKKAHNFFYRSLEKLLANALEGFEDENYLDEIARRVKKEQTLKRSKIFNEQSAFMQDKITHIKSNLFIIKNSFEDIIKIAQIAKNEKFKLWLDNSANLTLEIIAQKGFDLQAPLTCLSRFNLIFLSFFELFDEKIYIKIEYSNSINDEQKERLLSELYASLNASAKSKLKKPIIKKEELKFDFDYSKNYVKLNLNTKDQLGLMAFVMRVFNEFKLDLSAAKIQTIRGRTRNSFYFQKTKELLQNSKELLNSLASE